MTDDERHLLELLRLAAEVLGPLRAYSRRHSRMSTMEAKRTVSGHAGTAAPRPFHKADLSGYDGLFWALAQEKRASALTSLPRNSADVALGTS
jgi:hypothetical protein